MNKTGVDFEFRNAILLRLLICELGLFVNLSALLRIKLSRAAIRS